MVPLMITMIDITATTLMMMMITVIKYVDDYGDYF